MIDLSDPGMIRELVNPFIGSLQSVMQTMVQSKCEPGPMKTVSEGAHLFGVSAMIGLSGELTGALTFSTSPKSACMILERMAGMEATEPDEFVRDAIGEISNMVAGYGKRDLEKYQLKLGLPQVLIGEGIVLYTPRWAQHVWMHVETDVGPCTLDIGFSASPQ
jgi:chemotaxis protein CheX